MRNRLIYLTTIVTLVAMSGCSGVGDVAAPDFEQSVRQHLRSVETRDFNGFRETLTTSNDLNVIFPGGTILKDTQAVLDFHKNWFKDKEWIFQTELIKIIVGSDQSTALVKYKFQDTPDDPPREAWLVLTFQLEANQWRLIHDQNTRISD